MSIYRVRARFDGGEWVEAAGGRVYRTLSAAKGVVTQMRQRYARGRDWDRRVREYKIQEATTEWVDVDG